jgi:hypothetical protein
VHQRDVASVDDLLDGKVEASLQGGKRRQLLAQISPILRGLPA